MLNYRIVRVCSIKTAGSVGFPISPFSLCALRDLLRLRDIKVKFEMECRICLV